MPTSGTHQFWDTKNVQFLTEAYERLGIVGDLVDAQKIQSATRTANLILSEWLNRGFNQWTLKQGMIGLIPGQKAYILPKSVSRIVNAFLRTNVRNIGGVAFSSAGGNAQNAFDYNPLTACTQTSPDGYISYNYGYPNAYAIELVGIVSEESLNYSLTFDYSNDGITWITLYEIPAQEFLKGIPYWFVIPTPRLGQYFRVKETGGQTLNIQELYFNTMVRDKRLTALSNSDYTAIPNKNNISEPTSFWLDRQIQPVMYVWSVPSPLYNIIYYTYIEAIEDFGTLINISDIPQRFYEAFCAELGSRLSLKFKPELYPLLSPVAREAFDLAAREDAENISIRIETGYPGGGF
ncbi:MAG TPA: hypothetical protein VHA52_09975 [Candidatus Babeliaceae bacterium]|nr:hypothetical protein [Candidatus Babeliaceae bacterium]